MSDLIYRAAELLVSAWVGIYLVGVPGQARRQRRAEIASDLYEHRRDVQEQRRSPAAAALGLLVRCTAGVLDDLSWRSEVGSALGVTSMLRKIGAPGRVALATALILMLPLVAMQFTGEVDWTPFDFVFMGVLLFGAGLTYELVAKRMTSIAYRCAAGIAVASALLLVVVNGAVGIIGSEDNAANAMYFGVLAVGAGGAIISRFQPRGMARTLYATALAQALVAVIALIAVETSPSFWGEEMSAQGPSTDTLEPERLVSLVWKDAAWIQDPSPVFQIVGANGMFIVLFLVSARLFQTAAARGQTPASPGPEAPRSI